MSLDRKLKITAAWNAAVFRFLLNYFIKSGLTSTNLYLAKLVRHGLRRNMALAQELESIQFQPADEDSEVIFEPEISLDEKMKEEWDKKAIDELNKLWEKQDPSWYKNIFKQEEK